MAEVSQETIHYMLFSRFDSHGTNNAMIAIVFSALLFIWLSWFLCADKIIAPESGIVALALRSAKAKATESDQARKRQSPFILIWPASRPQTPPENRGKPFAFHHCFNEVEEIKAVGQISCSI